MKHEASLRVRLQESGGPVQADRPARPGSGPGATRREVLQKGLSIVGWGTLLAGLGAGTYETVRFFFPSVVFHPPSLFQIGRIEDFLSTEPPDAHGVILIDPRFKEQHRFFVVRDPKRIYALYARCTHLGCTVNWFPALRIFKCPCHGSEFHSDGKEFAGPAPRPLDRLEIGLDPEGNILVDTRVVYTIQEFERKKAYIELG